MSSPGGGPLSHLPTLCGTTRQHPSDGKEHTTGDGPTTLTASFGRLFAPVGTFSILRSVSMPSTTLPNTTCLLSRKSHFAVVMKNCPPARASQSCKGPGTRKGRTWQPFVFAPELAMESRPGPVCFSVKFSSCTASEETRMVEERRTNRELFAVDGERAGAVALDKVTACRSRDAG
jgi:hypothetical protein